MSNKNQILFVVISVVCLGFAMSASAYVMGSNNYQMEKDSVNVGGLDNSSSTNYMIKDTVGEAGTGTSSSSNYFMSAGYRQMDETYISITPPSPVNLSPEIGGITGGSATATAAWNVRTDDSAGYRMTIEATTDPAMQSGANSFDDYSPVVGGTPDYDWSLAGANSEFGFSPYNLTDQVAKYKNNGVSCNTGSNITDEKCWNGFSTTRETIVNRGSRTEPNGSSTDINFKAELDASGLQEEGTYTATIVVTAISN